MSQELTDAEWLRYQVATVDDPPNQPPEGSECIYLTNEFVTRMRSIADRLERLERQGSQRCNNPACFNSL